jgi:uncharacterized membrane protein
MTEAEVNENKGSKASNRTGQSAQSRNTSQSQDWNRMPEMGHFDQNQSRQGQTASRYSLNSSVGEINVGNVERAASFAGGIAMMALGVQRRSLASIPLALLGGALIYRGASGHCSVYSAMDINTATKKLADRHTETVEISRKLTIDKPKSEVYAFWRKLENLPRFMHHLEEVKQIDERRSHWVAVAPAHMGRISWDAVIVDEKENERLSWRSISDAMIENSGEVIFRDAPDGYGTELQVQIRYSPPAGAAGGAIMRLFNPVFSSLISEDVQRFKQVMETGKLSSSDGQAKTQPMRH